MIFFVSCQFQSSSVPCANITKAVFDMNYGKCFLVDVEKDRKQTSALNGLKLILDLKSSEYPDDVNLAPRSLGVLVGVAKNIEPTSFDKIAIATKLEARFILRNSTSNLSM